MKVCQSFQVNVTFLTEELLVVLDAIYKAANTNLNKHIPSPSFIKFLYFLIELFTLFNERKSRGNSDKGDYYLIIE